MKLIDFKKYLDLRKYFSLNISAIVGFYYAYLSYVYAHTEFPPYVYNGEGLEPSAEESIWLFKLTAISLSFLFFTTLFIIEAILKILIDFIQKKYFNKQSKEKNKKSKSKIFLFFEIIYSILFIIGNIPLFYTSLVFVLFYLGIDIRYF